MHTLIPPRINCIGLIKLPYTHRLYYVLYKNIPVTLVSFLIHIMEMRTAYIVVE